MHVTKLTKITNAADGTLKHYETYIQKLEDFAKSIGIKVVRRQESHDGAWIPAKNKITLDVDLSEIDEVSTFLHELGHCLDDTLFDDGKLINSTHRSYYAVYYGKPTKIQLEKVVEVERRAWKFGKRLARRLGIRLGKWYDDAVKMSIRSYQKS